MRAAGSGKQAANVPREPNFEEAVAKLYAEQAASGDRTTWIRATRLRHTALAMASLAHVPAKWTPVRRQEHAPRKEIAEAIRELKAEIAELQGGSGNPER